MSTQRAMNDDSRLEWPDAGSRIAALARILEERRDSRARDEVELFERSSWRLRATRRPAERRIAIDASEERGLAVRRVDRSRATVGFAACGGAPDAVRWAFEAAARAATRVRRDALAGLPAGGDEPCHDLDAPPDAVDPESLRGAVARLDAAIVASLPRTLAPRVRQAWVETAVTLETLVTTTGLRRARVRARTWAYHVLEWRTGGEAFSRPHLLATRGTRVPDLPADDARAAALAGAHRRVGPAREPDAWIAEADSAATLVRALGRARAAGGHGLGGGPIGDGFRVVDRPTAPEALHGGTWDDVGRPTADLGWTAGEEDTGWTAAGHLWRGSYRDPPAVMPSHLVVEPAPWSPPGGVPVLYDVRIHPQGSRRWTLVGLGGAEGRIVFEVDPASLPSRCVGSSGTTRTAAVGVTTPGLAFVRSA